LVADDVNEADVTIWSQSGVDLSQLEDGQVGGIVVDASGAVVTGATVSVVNRQTGATQTVTTDGEGRWVVSGVQSGPVQVKVESTGFKNSVHELNFSPSRPSMLGITMEVGQMSETITVMRDQRELERQGRQLEERARKDLEARQNAPSANVMSLQKRVAGILPVQVDVPRAGKSYRFVRPLVLDEGTTVSFKYRALR
jgi:hypothetical protein